MKIWPQGPLKLNLTLDDCSIVYFVQASGYMYALRLTQTDLNFIKVC